MYHFTVWGDLGSPLMHVRQALGAQGQCASTCNIPYCFFHFCSPTHHTVVIRTYCTSDWQSHTISSFHFLTRYAAKYMCIKLCMPFLIDCVVWNLHILSPNAVVRFCSDVRAMCHAIQISTVSVSAHPVQLHIWLSVPYSLWQR